MGYTLLNTVIHADWSANQNKRWLAQAELTSSGSYQVHPPERVEKKLSEFLQRIKSMVKSQDCLLLGFDFPIGLPLKYARKARITDFLSALVQFGEGEWRDFYKVAENPEEIKLHRPFYPHRPGNSRHVHLIEKLGCGDFNDLRRVCERSHSGRRAAARCFGR